MTERDRFVVDGSQNPQNLVDGTSKEFPPPINVGVGRAIRMHGSQLLEVAASPGQDGVKRRDQSRTKQQTEEPVETRSGRYQPEALTSTAAPFTRPWARSARA